uniref:GOLD domain-containing protein n=1 Tax=Caenorhabditis japonica TaxID=281687 RepID=A0A8R1IQ22_CAEJA
KVKRRSRSTMTTTWFTRNSIATEFVPEDGDVAAEEPGVYKFVFDNTHSKLRSKAVKYFIEVRNPEK